MTTRTMPEYPVTLPLFSIQVVAEDKYKLLRDYAQSGDEEIKALRQDVEKLRGDRTYCDPWIKVAEAQAKMLSATERAEQAERRAAEMQIKCAIAASTHSQYPITTDYDIGYAMGREHAAAAIRRMK